MKVAWVCLVGVTALSFGQTVTPGRLMRSPAPDIWQRSKECASQAEKLMASVDSRSAELGGWVEWTNHYSRKYDKCFVSAFYIYKNKDEERKPSQTTSMLFVTKLIDAFERLDLASTGGLLPAERHCFIDKKVADCEKAENFISDHMKN